MINRVILVGRMTRDPELRNTANGSAVVNFTLAISRNFSNSDGERGTDFINCVIWNKAAENVSKYCCKGSLVGVEGRLQSRQYDAQDGSKRTVVEVICDSIQFLETKGSREGSESTASTQDIDFDKIENPFELKDEDIQF